MSESITEIWAGLRDAGMPDVMLFLPDGTASRCHWDETAMVGATRVALLGDQERKIVRVVPVETCVGIGVASPKGIDTSNFKSVVQSKLNERFPRIPARPAGLHGAMAGDRVVGLGNGSPQPSMAHPERGWNFS